jgi:hypothetical protein
MKLESTDAVLLSDHVFSVVPSFVGGCSNSLVIPHFGVELSSPDDVSNPFKVSFSKEDSLLLLVESSSLSEIPFVSFNCGSRVSF